jgi:hypothetical protein
LRNGLCLFGSISSNTSQAIYSGETEVNCLFPTKSSVHHLPRPLSSSFHLRHFDIHFNLHPQQLHNPTPTFTMGNDGGSIPTRRELVKEAAKALTTQQVKEVQNEQQEHAWSNDPLTRKPLARPVVSDSAGILYNKDSIIEYLLSEPSDAKRVEADKVLQGRVSSLKDVVEVKFEVDTAAGARNTLLGSNGSTGRSERWVCNIANVELGPAAKAVYLVPCGHAFAGSVVKEVSGETCLQCNEPYAENDVIPILPTVATDIARLNLRIKGLRERGLTHALKKAPGSKKRKKGAEKEASATTSAGLTTGDLPPTPPKDSSEDDKTAIKLREKKDKAPKASDGIKNASTAFITKKVLEEQEERNKRRKLAQNDNVKSLFSNRSEAPDKNKSADYMFRGFSLGKKIAKQE